jgi:hypothetical protein
MEPLLDRLSQTKCFTMLTGYSEDLERFTRAHTSNRNTDCTDEAAIGVFRSCIIGAAWVEYHGVQRGVGT